MRRSFYISADYFEMPTLDAVSSQNIDIYTVSWTPRGGRRVGDASGRYATCSDVVNVMLFCVSVVSVRD
jgi:hypothetical protein